MTPGGPFYKGDIWELEIRITSPKTGKPGKPEHVKVKVTNPAGGTTEYTAHEVEGEPGVYELEPEAVELNEVGEWLAIIVTSPPYKGLRPIAIKVYPESAAPKSPLG